MIDALIRWSLHNKLIVLTGLSGSGKSTLALAVMHLAWGGAFWWGWLSSFTRGKRESAG